VSEYITAGEAQMIRFTRPVTLFATTKPVEMIGGPYAPEMTEVIISGDRLQFRWNNAYAVNVPMELVESIAWRSETKPKPEYPGGEE
jgi:hypothetical protein